MVTEAQFSSGPAPAQLEDRPEVRRALWGIMNQCHTLANNKDCRGELFQISSLTVPASKLFFGSDSSSKSCNLCLSFRCLSSRQNRRKLQF